MSRLRIAIWAESLAGPPTGTRTMLEALIRGLSSRHGEKVEVTLLAPAWADLDELRSRVPPSVAIRTIRGRRWPLRLLWLAGGGDLSAQVGQHDVWVSGWQWPLGGRDRPFVAILHDLRMLDPTWSDLAGDPLRRTIWRTLWDLSVRAGLARAAAVVTPSRYTRDHLAELGYRPRRPVTVIPHGVDDAYFQESPVRPEAVLGRLGVPGSDYVLGLGQHVPHKNFLRLVEAFAAGLAQAEPDARLVLAGRENVQTEALRARAAALGVGDRVILTGGLPHAELQGLLVGARVFAFPSLFEGFGLPVLEAMARGVPVMTSDTTSLAEIGEGVTLQVPPTDVGAMSAALLRLWRDEALRRDLADRGLDHARRHTWDAAVDRYLEVFTAAAGAA